MTDHEPPVDLSALDPTLPPAAFDRRLSAVHQAAIPALARRRNGGTPFFLMTRWRAPLMAALFLVMVVSAALLRGARVEATAEPDGDELADALGLSSPLGSVMLSDTTSAADILLGAYDR